MKIDNRSIFHDNDIRRIANFVMPNLVKFALEKCNTKLTIQVRTDDVTTGNNVSNGNNEWLMSVIVGRSGYKYPRMEEIDMSYAGRMHRATGGGTCDYITTFHRNLEEHIVHVIAHEMFHIEQYLYWKVLHGKEQFSDKIWNDHDADRYAIRKQREWRQRSREYCYTQPDTIMVRAK